MWTSIQNRAEQLLLAVLALGVISCHSEFCGEEFDVTMQCMKNYGRELNKQPKTTPITCAAYCRDNSACLSAVFDPQNGECTTNAGKATMFAKRCDYKMAYLTLKGSSCRPVQFGACDRKKGDGECSVANSRCYNETCECIRGFSYSLSERTCVEECDEYGDTFIKIQGFYIPGLNRVSLYNVDLDYAIQMCLQTTDFTCLTVEYNNRNAALSTEAPLIGVMTKDTMSDIYHRNCV